MKVTLGGDRLGSGNKLHQYLHNYYRSTHNLSQKWASSMTSGVLYPFLCMPAMRGDKFEIDLAAACRTIPTKGPLFGSYKMQVDVFQVPVRLYQAFLHNNPASIGLKMNQVKFPLLRIKSANRKQISNIDGAKMNNTSLVKYMGLSGLGHNAAVGNFNLERDINAIPFLAYYDIFKNYYSNKQEENAYVIGVDTETRIEYNINDAKVLAGATISKKVDSSTNEYYEIKPTSYSEGYQVIFGLQFSHKMNLESILNNIVMEFYDDENDRVGYDNIFNLAGDGILAYNGYHEETDALVITLDAGKVETWLNADYDTIRIYTHQDGDRNVKLKLKSFKLENIDIMRMKLLSYHELGSPFMLMNADEEIDCWGNDSGVDNTGLPYSTLFTIDSKNQTHNQYPLNGLMVKTYQSDIYNNWIRTEWIDGENGISAMTAVSVSGGSFKIDALNMAEKLYDLYNRIAVSGNTYEDWQNAVWTEMPRLHIETPVYLGGMSSEVVFEEIVQTAPASEEGGEGLGTLGGRGTLIKRKGGNVHAKIGEPSFIIGIVSLTPRVFYTQGNEFYLTDLLSVDDFHKPALDGIGFQNLIAERMAWWDTAIVPGGIVAHRSTIGKLPAWLNYMTAVDKAFGDFADDEKGEEGANFMILSRRYEPNEEFTGIADASTYIDPEKFNYAFAYTKLDAQNFWVQINSKIIARRFMSAKQIPNI